MSTEDVSKERYNIYMRGWTHGAAGKSVADHSGWRHDLVVAYSSGYADGRVARNHAARDAAEGYGHTPSILRKQSVTIV